MRLYTEKDMAQTESKVAPSTMVSGASIFAFAAVGFLAAGVLTKLVVRRRRNTRQVQTGDVSDLEVPLE